MRDSGPDINAEIENRKMKLEIRTSEKEERSEQHRKVKRNKISGERILVDQRQGEQETEGTLGVGIVVY